MTKLHDELMKLAYERAAQIMAQKNEVLEAFIAKYGFEPDRFVMVQQMTHGGGSEWSVRCRSDEEMGRIRRGDYRMSDSVGDFYASEAWGMPR